MSLASTDLSVHPLAANTFNRYSYSKGFGIQWTAWSSGSAMLAHVDCVMCPTCYPAAVWVVPDVSESSHRPLPDMNVRPFLCAQPDYLDAQHPTKQVQDVVSSGSPCPSGNSTKPHLRCPKERLQQGNMFWHRIRPCQASSAARYGGCFSRWPCGTPKAGSCWGPYDV